MSLLLPSDPPRSAWLLLDARFLTPAVPAIDHKTNVVHQINIKDVRKQAISSVKMRVEICADGEAPQHCRQPKRRDVTEFTYIQTPLLTISKATSKASQKPGKTSIY
jgi:hypothetical protein